MKNLKNLGEILNKKEQKTINGGRTYCDLSHPSCSCPPGEVCVTSGPNDPTGYCMPFIMD